MNAVEKQQLQFIITSPNHIVNYVSKGAKSIATLQSAYHNHPSQFFSASVITKADNHFINSLSDLRNNSVAASSPFEFGGYQMMLREFIRSGITPEKDFFELLFTNGSQTRIINAVLHDEIDAGIIRSGLIEEMTQSGLLSPNTLKVISPKSRSGFPLKHSSALYAQWGIINLPYTDVGLSREVAAKLFTMPKSPLELPYQSHYGWHFPADLDTVRGLLRALKLPPYTPHKISLMALWEEYAFEASTVLVLILVLTLSIAHVSRVNRKLALSKQELAKHRNNLGQEVIQQTQELSLVNQILEEDIRAREAVEATLRRSREALQGFYEISIDYHASYTEKVDKLIKLACIHFQMDATFLYNISTAEPGITGTEHLLLQSFYGDKSYENETLYNLKLANFEPNSTQIQNHENIHSNKRLQSITIQVNEQPNRFLIFIGERTKHTELTDVDQELLRLMTQWIASGIERQAIEEERENYRAQVGKITRLFTAGELATGLAHEINQPLTAAANYISGSLIRLKEDSSANIEVGLTRSLDSLNLASNIIKRLREFVQTGIPQHQTFDLNVSINRVLDILMTEAHRQRIELKAPSLSTEQCVMGDKIQIEQVILNLVRNAIEASTVGGIVSIEVTHLAHKVKVNVIDMGTGVDETEIQSIFDAFHSSKTEGMGLGLAICRSIIEAHHSTLQIQNNDLGCQFTFTLPQAKLCTPMTDQNIQTSSAKQDSLSEKSKVN
ncbi:MAG: sensor histidine kinase [Gammaproteobacteria bacterium]|nr:sensor histidine kinase [Gammaproteobacteria bacterium]